MFSQFLPVLFGSSITPAERRLFSLPAKFGGLGILDPVWSASGSYQASVHATSVLTAPIREGLAFDLESHVDNVLSVWHQETISRDTASCLMIYCWSLMLIINGLFSVPRTRIFLPG